MPGRQAKAIRPGQLRLLLRHVAKQQNPIRSRVMVLLSLKAGLRAAEIAKLEWSMLLDPSGSISNSLEVHDRIAKKQSGRRIPIHPELRRALIALAVHTGTNGPVIKSRKRGHLRPNSVVNWFKAQYGAIGLAGCSSHSGRRTFITNAARQLHKTGGSLRDVQLLAGHSSIVTTQRYIDGDTDAQRKLVSLV
jgi:integrase